MSSYTINLTFVDITLQNDIFHVQPHKNAIATIKHMHQVHKSFQKLSHGTKHPALIDMTNVQTIDYAARKYIAEETGDVINAVALITRSPISRVIGNFFIGINKPTYPARLFTNQHDAIHWLQEVTKQP